MFLLIYSGLKGTQPRPAYVEKCIMVQVFLDSSAECARIYAMFYPRFGDFVPCFANGVYQCVCVRFYRICQRLKKIHHGKPKMTPNKHFGAG